METRNDAVEGCERFDWEGGEEKEWGEGDECEDLVGVV